MKVSHALAAFITGLGLGSILLVIPVANSAEGGYSNYIPGSYGDFGMAVAPVGKLTLRNDVYYYNADIDRSVRPGRTEIGAEQTFLSNFMTLLYKPEVEFLGAQYAFGVFLPFTHVDIESDISWAGRTLRADDDI
jgi:hypothetical protein